jgi:hypothetical protein
VFEEYLGRGRGYPEGFCFSPKQSQRGWGSDDCFATDPIRRTRIPTSRLVAKAIDRLQDSATIASSQKGQWFRVA